MTQVKTQESENKQWQGKKKQTTKQQKKQDERPNTLQGY